MKKRDKYIISAACALFAIVSVLIIVFRDRSNEENRNDGFVDNHIIENYIFIAHPTFSLSTSSSPSGMLVHEDTIYYWYENPDSEIVIVGLAAEGSGTTETRIAVNGWQVSAGGLRITDDGNFSLVISAYNDNGNIITYSEYCRQGVLISALELSGVSIPELDFLWIEQVVYSTDGSFAVVAGNKSLVEYTLHINRMFLFDSEGTPLGSLETYSNQSMVRLRDGRVVVLFRADSESYLLEIDFTGGNWGESIALKIPRARNLIPSGENRTFDFLVDDGRNIIGYTLDGNIQTPLLDWQEMRPITFIYSHADTFSDGRTVIMSNPVYLHDSRSFSWSTDIFLLTPKLRTEAENRTVLTIGGLWFTEEMQSEVNAFNRENRDYRIELREYGGNEIDIDVSKAHFLINMLTGQGPDIIVDPWNLLDSREYLIDLYPLIDADPEINRSDFFPNALSAMEAPDGTLPLLNNVFTVSTMITMYETAAQLEPLTFSRIRSRLNEPDGPDLFGMWHPSRDIFLLNSVFMSDGDFIDWSNNTAKFNKSSFADMLEISARLPSSEETEENYRSATLEEESIYWDGLRNGHILLHDTWIHSITELQALQAALGDIVAVGVPTDNGGRHVIMTYGDIGISAMSEHQETAWSFVRRLLLPEAAVTNYALPLRIDIFEEQIAEMMTPRITAGVEQSVTVRLARHYQVQLYAMTEDEAADIRSVVYNAVVVDMPFRYAYDEAVEMIVTILTEESRIFFEGRRPAMETARVIQNRVQAYLDGR